MQLQRFSFLASGLALLVLNGVHAAESPRRGPPPEAIEACASLSTGSVCEMNTPRGTAEGSCQTIPEGQLACVPAGHTPGQGQPPGQGQGQPPQNNQ